MRPDRNSPINRLGCVVLAAILLGVATPSAASLLGDQANFEAMLTNVSGTGGSGIITSESGVTIVDPGREFSPAGPQIDVGPDFIQIDFDFTPVPAGPFTLHRLFPTTQFTFSDLDPRDASGNLITGGIVGATVSTDLTPSDFLFDVGPDRVDIQLRTQLSTASFVQSGNFIRFFRLELQFAPATVPAPAPQAAVLVLVGLILAGARVCRRNADVRKATQRA